MAQRLNIPRPLLFGMLAVLGSGFVVFLLTRTDLRTNTGESGGQARATRNADGLSRSPESRNSLSDSALSPSRAKGSTETVHAPPVFPPAQPSSLASGSSLPGGPGMPGAPRAEGSLPAPDSAPSPRPPFDPENQPRTFWNLPLGATNLSAYLLEGLQQSPNGLTLAEAQSGTGRFVRAGRLESPPILADFPFNALVPLWRADLKPGTDFELEASVGPDGATWSRWYAIEPDDDGPGQIQPTFPDGRENPSYGFVPGEMLVWGTTQWKYFRFRASLYSDGTGSPTLSAFRFYYQDSTLGRGKIATAQDILDPSAE